MQKHPKHDRGHTACPFRLSDRLLSYEKVHQGCYATWISQGIGNLTEKSGKSQGISAFYLKFSKSQGI